MTESTGTADDTPRGSTPERIEGTREECEGLWQALRAMGYMPSDMEIRRVPEHDEPGLEYEACCVQIWNKELALTPPARTGPERPAPPEQGKPVPPD